MVHPLAVGLRASPTHPLHIAITAVDVAPLGCACAFTSPSVSVCGADTTVGAWMLGHNVTHFEDMRLCTTGCSAASIGVLHNECAGLCNPVEDMHTLHLDKACHQDTVQGGAVVKLSMGDEGHVDADGSGAEGVASGADSAHVEGAAGRQLSLPYLPSYKDHTAFEKMWVTV